MPVGDSPDDNHATSLIKRIRNGDTQAETEFCEQYYTRIYESAVRHCKDKDAAREFCQEAFCVVLPKLRTGNGPDDDSKAPAYVFGIVKKLRSGKFRKKEHTAVNTDLEKVARSVCARPTPAENAMAGQQDAVVREMLDSLPNEGYRDMLRRFYLFGESKSVICQAMAISPKQFDVRMHRAKKSFLKHLEERGGGRTDG